MNEYEKTIGCLQKAEVQWFFLFKILSVDA